MAIIHVPDTAVLRFQSLSEKPQELDCQLVVDCIAEPSKLAEAMDYLHFKAEKSSLPPNGVE